MAKDHAIRGAQEELPALGATGVVVDVQRAGRQAVITLRDGQTITVQGPVAIKLLKMLRARFGRPWGKRDT